MQLRFVLKISSEIEWSVWNPSKGSHSFSAIGVQKERK